MDFQSVVLPTANARRTRSPSYGPQANVRRTRSPSYCPQANARRTRSPSYVSQPPFTLLTLGQNSSSSAVHQRPSAVRFFDCEYSLKKDSSIPDEASLGFDFEDRFDLDGRAGRDLGKPQSASSMEPVGGFAVDFMEQIAATVDHKVLLVEFQGRVHATKEL